MKKLILKSLLVIGLTLSFTGCATTDFVKENYTYEDGKVHSKITGNTYDKDDAKAVVDTSKKAVEFVKEKKETANSK